MAEDWLVRITAELKSESDYTERALLSAVLSYQDDLKQRRMNAEGELDGRIWNHEQW